MRTLCCVLYAPEHVAVASIYLASRSLGIKLPEFPRPWYELFDASWTEIQEISRLILSVYQFPQPHYVCLVPEEEQQQVNENSNGGGFLT